MTETLMTDATTTSESVDTSAPVAEAPTGAETAGTQQQPAAQQDQQVAESASAESGTEEAPGEPAKRAPESYAFTAPEGKNYDNEVISSFEDAARELDLTQEEAQLMLDKVAPKLADRQAQQIAALREGWSESSKADNEFGGEKLAENLATAKKALDAFGSPELKQLLNESGLGNHPEVIRMMYRAGKSISEDTFVGASQGSGAGKGQPKDFAGYADALYSSKP